MKHQMGDLREDNSLCITGSGVDKPALLLPSTTTTTTAIATESLISNERWARAEKSTRQIIYKVLPTDVSGKMRREIIDFIYRLIKTRTGCEVFPYGSVPLKTYLPDGDIDLTAFGGPLSEDLLADQIVSLLQRDNQNEDTEFIVKDVQLIRAEVKIVKCIVQNVVVDISLNQIGGLCTLCFLEQVDRVIGKDHLFKRSIILIKAWCYYESRLLGAPHGLISTYALETLVLYIFNLFHRSLNGPLAVLYKFLDHFSKFDWDNYVISINGPVRLDSLPELKAENGGIDLLLSTEFVRNCMAFYSVPSRGSELMSRAFYKKHLNIIDPLKENNNLGRSVSKGNFYRIRSAFSYGAQILDSILAQKQQNHDLNEELKKFFCNTLERHGSRSRPDVNGPRLLVSSIPESKPTFYIGTIEASGLTHQINGMKNETLDSLQSLKLNASIVSSSSDDEVNGSGVEDEGTFESSETMSYILTGDYQNHLQCFHYARLCFDYASNAFSMPVVASPPSPRPPPLFQYNHRPWVTAVHRHVNSYSHSSVNGVINTAPFYPMNPHLVPVRHFGSEDIHKPRGTGTYFPIPPIPNRVGHVFSRPPIVNERYMTPLRATGIDLNTRKPSQSTETVAQLSWVKVGPTNNQPSISPLSIANSISDGLAVHSEGNLDFVSKEAPPVLERSSHGQQQQKDFAVAIPISPTVEVQMPKAVDTEDDDRISKKSSYHLKDDEDFPPLSM